MLVPLADQRRYRLYLQASLDESAAIGLASDLDQELRHNPHYAYARDLGQLGPVDVALLDGPVWDRYVEHRVRQGCRAGSVKPMMLDPRTDWPLVLEELRRPPARI
jgi:hypothetical protein